jgi:hypothetical protein
VDPVADPWLAVIAAALATEHVAIGSLLTPLPRRRPLRRAARWDGAYLMTVRQDTGQLLSPYDITQIANFLRERRADRTTGDIAFNPVPATDAAPTRDPVQAFSEAGASWWIVAEGVVVRRSLCPVRGRSRCRQVSRRSSCMPLCAVNRGRV